MLRRVLLLIGLCSVIGGCAKSPDMRVESTVTMQDLNSTIKASAVETHFFINDATVGLFPSGIAVARVQKAHTQPSSTTVSKTLQLFPPRSFEATYWAELFDGTAEVREMVLLHDRSVRSPDVTLDELLHAAQTLKARLLLVYGYDNLSVSQTCRVSGLLYDVNTQQLIASIDHTGTLRDAQLAAELLTEDVRPESDTDWDYYIDHVAFRTFEQEFKRCVWTMIDRDQPAAEESQENPYKNPAPAYPDALIVPGVIPGASQ
ncbi:MAG: hypothetical protein HJJLKODD_01069 [Phycisphaerae bacterium]|nr:hypothetical protein [Phycisphaerae bacterium]